MKCLTVEEAANILKVSLPTMYQTIHQREFPKVKIGRAWRIPETLFYQWIEESCKKEAS